MANLADFVTVTAAAERLGVSPLTIRRWCDAGKLEHTRHPINGYRLFDPADLDKFLRRVSESRTEYGAQKDRNS